MEWVGLIISFLALMLISGQQQAAHRRRLKGAAEGSESAPAPRAAAHKRPIARTAHKTKKPPPSRPRQAPLRDERHEPAAIPSRRRLSLAEPGRIPPLTVREEAAGQAPAPVQQTLHRLAFKRDLLIYHEILSLPKSLRSER